MLIKRLGCLMGSRVSLDKQERWVNSDINRRRSSVKPLDHDRVWVSLKYNGIPLEIFNLECKSLPEIWTAAIASIKSELLTSPG